MNNALHIALVILSTAAIWLGVVLFVMGAIFSSRFTAWLGIFISVLATILVSVLA